MNAFVTISAGISLAIAPLWAGAQQKTPASPADAKAAAPKVIYVSPLKDYRPIKEDAVGSWRSANEEVDKAGGWKAYLREGQQVTPPKASAPGTSSSPLPAKPPAPQGHAGH